MTPADTDNRDGPAPRRDEPQGRKGYGKPRANPVMGSDEPERPAHRPGQPGSADEPDRPGPSGRSRHPTGDHAPFERDIPSKG